MYVTPEILITLDARELLGDACGGNEGNGPNPTVGQGSEHDPK
jgi:hypothetical protein